MVTLPPPTASQPPPSVNAVRCPLCSFTLEVQGQELMWCPQHGRALVPLTALGALDSEVLGRVLAGRYVLLEQLGAGATSKVYRARDLQRGHEVALKVVSPLSQMLEEVQQRFEREARVLASLRSPHAVQLFDFGETHEGIWYMAMELLVGETLGTRLKAGPLEPLQALRVTEGALRALTEAHRQGIIHRDLKPENLFLVREAPGQGELCKVLDFGIAKVRQGRDLGLTARGAVMGTPRYMSPEQAQGHPLDARSDVYSMGVLLFQMLTGVPPFTGPDAVIVMAQHVREPAPLLTQLEPAFASAPQLVALVSAALAKLPADRPASSAEMLRRLALARAELGGMSRGTTTSGVVSRPTPSTLQTSQSGRQGALALFAAGALGALCIGVYSGARWLSAPKAESLAGPVSEPYPGQPSTSVVSGAAQGSPASAHAPTRPEVSTERSSGQTRSGAPGSAPSARAASARSMDVAPSAAPTTGDVARALVQPSSARGASVVGAAADAPASQGAR